MVLHVAYNVEVYRVDERRVGQQPHYAQLRRRHVLGCDRRRAGNDQRGHGCQGARGFGRRSSRRRHSRGLQRRRRVRSWSRRRRSVGGRRLSGRGVGGGTGGGGLRRVGYVDGRCLGFGHGCRLVAAQLVGAVCAQRAADDVGVVALGSVAAATRVAGACRVAAQRIRALRQKHTAGDVGGSGLLFVVRLANVPGVVARSVAAPRVRAVSSAGTTHDKGLVVRIKVPRRAGVLHAERLATLGLRAWAVTRRVLRSINVLESCRAGKAAAQRVAALVGRTRGRRRSADDELRSPFAHVLARAGDVGVVASRIAALRVGAVQGRHATRDCRAAALVGQAACAHVSSAECIAAHRIGTVGNGRPADDAGGVALLREVRRAGKRTVVTRRVATTGVSAVSCAGSAYSQVVVPHSAVAWRTDVLRAECLAALRRRTCLTARRGQQRDRLEVHRASVAATRRRAAHRFSATRRCVAAHGYVGRRTRNGVGPAREPCVAARGLAADGHVAVCNGGTAPCARRRSFNDEANATGKPDVVTRGVAAQGGGGAAADRAAAAREGCRVGLQRETCAAGKSAACGVAAQRIAALHCRATACEASSRCLEREAGAAPEARVHARHVATGVCATVSSGGAADSVACVALQCKAHAARERSVVAQHVAADRIAAAGHRASARDGVCCRFRMVPRAARECAVAAHRHATESVRALCRQRAAHSLARLKDAGKPCGARESAVRARDVAADREAAGKRSVAADDARRASLCSVAETAHEAVAGSVAAFVPAAVSRRAAAPNGIGACLRRVRRATRKGSARYVAAQVIGAVCGQRATPRHGLVRFVNESAGARVEGAVRVAALRRRAVGGSRAAEDVLGTHLYNIVCRAAEGRSAGDVATRGIRAVRDICSAGSAARRIFQLQPNRTRVPGTKRFAALRRRTRPGTAYGCCHRDALVMERAEQRGTRRLATRRARAVLGLLSAHDRVRRSLFDELSRAGDVGVVASRVAARRVVARAPADGGTGLRGEARTARVCAAGRESDERVVDLKAEGEILAGDEVLGRVVVRTRRHDHLQGRRRVARQKLRRVGRTAGAAGGAVCRKNDVVEARAGTGRGGCRTGTPRHGAPAVLQGEGGVGGCRRVNGVACAAAAGQGCADRFENSNAGNRDGRPGGRDLLDTSVPNCSVNAGEVGACCVHTSQSNQDEAAYVACPQASHPATPMKYRYCSF
eukprot:Rhum_TRINITY_DN11036_c0_g1::Rhum_TRINITY_DN11036_c0_g1_i1::g.42061::m.42061